MGFGKYIAVFVSLAVFSFTSCSSLPHDVDPEASPKASSSTPSDAAPEFKSTALTRDAEDVYEVSAEPDGVLKVTAEASNSTENNTRIVVWQAGASESTNGQACATFTNNDPIAQEGIALRIREGANKTTAVTVTKNIIYGNYSTFQFHTWDTSREGFPFERFGSAKFDGLVTGIRHVKYPWRICAKASGRTITANVWPASEPEPSWSDPNSTASMEIPADHGPEFDEAGQFGIYAGHLPPNKSITFSEIEVRR